MHDKFYKGESTQSRYNIVSMQISFLRLAAYLVAILPILPAYGIPVGERPVDEPKGGAVFKRSLRDPAGGAAFEHRLQPGFVGDGSLGHSLPDPAGGVVFERDAKSDVSEGTKSSEPVVGYRKQEMTVDGTESERRSIEAHKDGEATVMVAWRRSLPDPAGGAVFGRNAIGQDIVGNSQKASLFRRALVDPAGGAVFERSLPDPAGGAVFGRSRGQDESGKRNPSHFIRDLAQDSGAGVTVGNDERIVTSTHPFERRAVADTDSEGLNWGWRLSPARGVYIDWNVIEKREEALH